MLSRSREDSALGLASLEAVLAAFASFLAVDGASLLPALEHLDPQAVLLLQHSRLQCEVDTAHFLNRAQNIFLQVQSLEARDLARTTRTQLLARERLVSVCFYSHLIKCGALDLGITF